MRPDWLDEALAGHPVALRNGNKAYVRHCEEELETKRPLIGFTISKGTVYNYEWLLNGRRSTFSEHREDIVGLWEEPAPVFEHWHLLRKEVTQIAKDQDEIWYGYDISPDMGIAVWANAAKENANLYGLQGLDSSLFPECDWKHSLIIRPTCECKRKTGEKA